LHYPHPCPIIELMKECTVLFSGGLDSTTTLIWAKHRFKKVQALSFQYGQRHSLEVELSRNTARRMTVPQTVVPLDFSFIGGSSLIDTEMPLPEFSRAEDIPEGPPSTYVPFRNGIFLSLAAAWSEARGIRDLAAGFNVIDSPDYPDTRPDFVKTMGTAINQGTGAGISGGNFHIHAPFIHHTKSDIIREGIKMGADYAYSISCYAGSEIPCGKCSSCRLREKAWQETGEKDHLLLRLKKEGKI